MRRANRYPNGMYLGNANATSKNLLYEHMSNHYRRILSAKKTIDNSSPIGRRVHQSPSPCRPELQPRSTSTNSCSGSSYCPPQHPHYPTPAGCRVTHVSRRSQPVPDMKLIDRIVSDTKYGPASYRNSNWNEIRSKQKKQKSLQEVYGTSKTRKRGAPVSNAKQATAVSTQAKIGDPRKYHERRKVTDIMERHDTCFQSLYDGFYPRILKTDASSKVKDLQVYHPPRRKPSSWVEDDNEEEEEEAEPEEEEGRKPCSCVEGCTCIRWTCRDKPTKHSKSQPSQSQTSSRDSAYNGGVPSVPESRSPTPDCRKEADSDYRVRKKEKKKVVRTATPSSRRGGEETLHTEKGGVEGAIREDADIRKDEEAVRNIRDEALYMALIDDITSEILEKQLSSNRALTKVMYKHMQRNGHKLDQKRMLREIDILREKLGIPKDRSQDEVTADRSHTFVYPAVSIDEYELFTRPYRYKNDTRGGKRTNAPVNHTVAMTMLTPHRTIRHVPTIPVSSEESLERIKTNTRHVEESAKDQNQVSFGDKEQTNRIPNEGEDRQEKKIGIGGLLNAKEKAHNGNAKEYLDDSDGNYSESKGRVLSFKELKLSSDEWPNFEKLDPPENSFSSEVLHTRTKDTSEFCHQTIVVSSNISSVPHQADVANDNNDESSSSSSDAVSCPIVLELTASELSSDHESIHLSE